MPRTRAFGITLVELLVTLAVIAMLLATALPAAMDLIDAKRVAGAAEAIRSQLHLARSEAIKQMEAMVVTYSMASNDNWRMGMREGVAECDTELSDPVQGQACSIRSGATRVLTVLSGTGFPGVSAHANRSSTRFNPVRGTSVGGNLTITLVSSRGKEVRVIVNNLGRVRTCSPAGAGKVGGYSPC